MYVTGLLLSMYALDPESCLDDGSASEGQVALRECPIRDDAPALPALAHARDEGVVIRINVESSAEAGLGDVVGVPGEVLLVHSEKL